MNRLASSLPVFALLPAVTAKVTIVLGLSWMIAGVLRRQSAAQRHRV
jgi:hypothetical protein